MVREHMQQAQLAQARVHNRGAQVNPDVLMRKQLTPHQIQDLRELLDQNRDAFSELPGRTSITAHDIVTEPGKKVRLRPYRVPEAQWEAIREEAKEKTAFAMPDGLFQYRVLPFGVHGALATFQRLIDQILQPHQEYAVAYLADIVVHSADWKTHLARLEVVLGALREAGLMANVVKCHLGLEEANYLGYTIGRGWFLGLQNFRFRVEHWAGKLHGNADALSRWEECLWSGAPDGDLELRGGVCGAPIPYRCPQRNTSNTTAAGPIGTTSP
ncbi:hypothetical protein SKAU_G00208770 [Synaphobranchus kaupii]|uniref:ribonuclease H n=1 Tax=Synaphobranchus kaupii TaxID=118154 RepID=A0A9Q1ISP4_SYNKA|nr:hypothetical protein SKAU_G00208770 [Synaphobranchus kaupii]